MAKLPLDLKNFKKVSSDGQSTTLRHAQGHEIKIAHAPLSPKYREQLASLPLHKADGGEIDKQDSAQPAADPTVININANPEPSAGMINPNPGSAAANYAPSNAQDQTIPGSEPFHGFAPNPADQSASTPQQEAPKGMAPGAPAPQQPQAPSDPYGTQAQMDAFSKGAGEYKAGLAQQAAAEGAASLKSAAALKESIAQQKQAQQTYQGHYNDLDKERQNFQSDIQNAHIDPNRYMNNMGTGQHVRTAIGLILGGFGSGITGGKNPVMEYLNDNINRDIDAQKAELGKKENLLSANMKQFGNLRDASDMTRVMQNDIVSNQMKQAAAQAGSSEAKAKMLLAAGQFDTQNAGLIGQMAMRKSLLSGMQDGHVAPERVVMALVPKEEQASAYKELQSAQSLSKSKDNILNAYDQVNQMALGGTFSPHQRDALVQPVLAQMVKDSEGRVTPQDTKMIEALFPSALDGEQTRILKRNQLNKFISEKMNFPLLQTYGINVGNMGRYNPQGQSRIQERPLGSQ